MPSSKKGYKYPIILCKIIKILVSETIINNQLGITLDLLSLFPLVLCRETQIMPSKIAIHSSKDFCLCFIYDFFFIFLP